MLTSAEMSKSAKIGKIVILLNVLVLSTQYSTIQSVELMAAKVNTTISTNNNSSDPQLFQLTNNKIGIAILQPAAQDPQYSAEQKISIVAVGRDGGIDFTTDSMENDGSNQQHQQQQQQQQQASAKIMLPKTLIEDANRGYNTSETSQQTSVQLIYFNDDSLFQVVESSSQPNNKNASSSEVSKIVSGVFSLKVIITTQFLLLLLLLFFLLMLISNSLTIPEFFGKLKFNGKII